jgi:hypothetical protein
MLHAEEKIWGNPLDPLNLFHYDEVILNLPGKPDYEPSKLWVYKYHSVDRNIAVDFFMHVDDVRTMGFTESSCWACAWAVASTLNHLGIQDAPRKQRGSSQDTGPWAGSTIFTSGTSVYVTVTVDRWSKAQKMVQWIHDCLTAGLSLCFKTLESYRGFLVYIG